jgi:hypothetical protein
MLEEKTLNFKLLNQISFTLIALSSVLWKDDFLFFIRKYYFFIETEI